MIKLMRTDLLRLGKSVSFRLALAAMLTLTGFFMAVQATAMDYTVPCSRVIFLPMSLYGIVMAAFVSSFVGTDFSDGFIRNKLIAAKDRRSVVVSAIAAGSVGCAVIYIIVTAFTAGLGPLFFENDVAPGTFFRYFLLGLAVSLSTGCLFSAITLICGRKTSAVIWCMGIAAGMLFLAVHTNSIMVQSEIRDGILNPRYVGGFRRAVNGALHELNPWGQVAQLSAWNVAHPVRGSLWNLLLTVCMTALGCTLFEKKDVE